MKRKTFGVSFFINKAKLLRSGEAGIYIRINVDGKRAEANIKRSVEVKNWDQSKEMAKGRDRKSNEINDCIRDLKLRALSIHKELELRGKFFTFSLILDMIFNNERSAILGVTSLLIVVRLVVYTRQNLFPYFSSFRIL